VISLLNKYNAAVRNTHGWRVDLFCGKCGFHGMPRYEGWVKGMDVHFADQPTIYAKFACPQCGNRLTEEAGKTLVGMFRDVPMPEKNSRIIGEFIVGLFLVPLLFAGLLVAGVQMGWWGYSAFMVLAASALFIQPLVMVMNYRIAMLRSSCPCGRPEYLFMGQLGRSACYCCSSCGRLLRLRD
jgi:hypothetical protein